MITPSRTRLHRRLAAVLPVAGLHERAAVAAGGGVATATAVTTDSGTERIGLPKPQCVHAHASIASPQETVFKVFEEHPEHIDSMTAVATRIALDRYQVF